MVITADFLSIYVKIYLLDSTQVEIIVDDKGILNKSNSVYYLYNDYKKGQIVYPANRILQDRRNKSEHILLLRRTDFRKCWARVNGIGRLDSRTKSR